MAGAEMLFEIDGAGVSPETVDTLTLLRLAGAWFRLATKVAAADRLGLTLRGLEVRDKCAAMVARANDADVARSVTRQLIAIVANDREAPHGATKDADDLRQGLRELRDDQHVSVRVGKANPLPLRARDAHPIDGPWEATELRVRLIRIGGEPNDRATFTSGSELGLFTLSVDRDNAMKLSPLLHRDVDVEVEFQRNRDGRIADGRVTAVHKLTTKDPLKALRSWFAPSAAAWEGVDLEVELGRRD